MKSSHLNEMNQSVKSLAVTSSKQLKEKNHDILGPAQNHLKITTERNKEDFQLAWPV